VSPDRSDDVLTVPNVLGALRFLGSPWLVLLGVAGRETAFLVLFLALTFTDWLDGKLAGWLDQRSKIGPRLDSLADLTMYAALVLGLGVGLLAAMRQGGLFDRLGTATAYVGLGLPHFFLAELLIVVAINELGWYGALWDSRYGLWSTENLTALALPMLVVTANLLAVQVRYARSESLEFVPADFVKRLRASGASSWRIARHVVRNAALPLLSVFFTETLTVLFVTVYVIEVVMEVPGLGSLAYNAILSRDSGVILAATCIPVLVGLVGNLVQDVAYAALDPRVSYED
jgi:peptide/nickel transport system permease protein